jgi:hypothetical protein
MRIDAFRNRTVEWQSRFLFRGQSDSRWELLPTIDRIRSFASVDQRAAVAERVLNAFSIEAGGMRDARSVPDDLEHVEEVARHSGLPTRLLDWTSSPYIAAYYAYRDIALNTRNDSQGHVAIWRLDKNKISEEMAQHFEVVNAQYYDNIRAIAQRSVFTRSRTTPANFQRLIGQCLVRIDIPRQFWKDAMVHLDLMNINSSSLFHSLDGAAEAVKIRHFSFRTEP